MSQVSEQDTIVFHEVGMTFKGASHAALESLSLTITPGVITGVVGPDGAGKTTALRILTGLIAPTSGTVSVFGYDATRQSHKVHEFLGYMPQKFGLYEDLTVQENLTLYAKLRNLPCNLRRERFNELLDFTGLGRFQKRLARRLSGGMKQKLGLACAMITTPRLLVLDEPGVGVDPLSRRELWTMVRELTQGQTAVVWSTSYLDEAQLCDRTLLLNQGKALFYGAPSEMTRAMVGRVVRVQGVPAEQKRREAIRILALPEVVDSTIQGSTIRVALSRRYEQATDPVKLFQNREATLTAPSFEDGFIEILGGAPKNDFTRRSALASQAREDSKAVVEARGLTKRFGSFTAASGIEFKIRRGEIFGLLGPNGAGKSTTFKMLCGLLRPTDGDGLVAGVSLRRSASDARRKLGYMAQKFSLYSDLTVLENLRFYAGVYGMSRAQRDEAIERAMVDYELARYSASHAGSLPLGYKQRLALATATIHSPEALFLDEPTSGVDPLARREFWNRVNSFAEQGVAILVTTHFMDEAEYCDEVALIMNGRKIAQGAPEELKASVVTPERPDPTLEDAFIQMILQERERAK
ncbi:MAG: ATP-binding cassette domain-containing protein [Planctomycetia bacterium]|nr:ATP-binding cassette domain-containing protein [Planctomycetia bacterium]